MNKIILPSLFVLIIVGLLIWGGTTVQKNKNSNTNSANTNQEASAPYFDENAKVMFFYSDLCSWCNKEKEEVLTPLAKEGYRVKLMDVKAHPDYFKQYNIEGTPTLIAPDGTKITGYKEKDELKAFLDKYK